MKTTLKINDTDVSQIVIDMAKLLKVDYHESQNEHCLNIPKEFGKGYIKTTTFEHGVGVVDIDFSLKKELILEFEHDIVHPLKFIFNRESSIKHSFEQDDDLHSIGRLESAIVASAPKNNHTFKIPANKSVCLFTIEINRKEFEEKIETFLSEMDDDLISMFRDVNGVNKFYYKGNYSLDIAQDLDECVECELEGFMKSVFLEGKTYAIVMSQLKQYLDDLNGPENRKILRQSTIKSIEKAVDIIKTELDTVANITVLAKRVGLNQNALQNGFKHLYDASVKEFIRDYRLEKARKLMETTGLNITQITYKIGINSRSYFSKIFKKKYGISPKAYMIKSRKEKSA
ncbi:helix-turn-helix domain-containing protein [Changchengzhania lutea]|uniref:helix-turn-helix domain-containing protein n=1 Tax=Changchengzhania lutea TaxID=2049305 RepID=UPI001FE4842F|nr:AraC family transcriptional regulator [Changchengzhania lutea]